MRKKLIKVRVYKDVEVKATEEEIEDGDYFYNACEVATDISREDFHDWDVEILKEEEDEKN